MENLVSLSARLQAIADLVDEGSRLADVGCDHAFLPIWLCQAERIPSAIAMDVRSGPLSRARDHIEAARLTDRICCRLSDGLAALREGEADIVTIAGMGGMLIRRILEGGGHVLPAIDVLIVSPQSDPDLVRDFLLSHGFAIVCESLILEDGKIYPVIKAGRTGQETSQALRDPLTLRYGSYLLERRDPVLRELLERQLRERERIRAELAAADTEHAKRRAGEVEEEICLIRSALSYYENR